jgi:asparagine synthase (glutamine-hydrolysing)
LTYGKRETLVAELDSASKALISIVVYTWEVSVGEMTSIHIRCSTAWCENNGVYVTGQAFYSGDLYNSSDLADHFRDISVFSEFVNEVKKLNGFYAIVVDLGGTLYAAVDHVRSIPLFYTTRSPVSVSDSGRWIKNRTGMGRYDPAAESEFLLSGYVTGSDTLFQALKTVQAGEALRIETGDETIIETQQYYRYYPKGYSSLTEKGLLAELDRVLSRVFNRLTHIADGRTIAIPLSGGIDSRLIAIMLKQTGYEDIIAFSFGLPENQDVKMSRQVAKNIGIQWEFVEYSTDLWYNWCRSSKREEYLKRHFHFSSVPRGGFLPAVCKLLDTGRVPTDTLFCPGHTVATPSEHIPAQITSTDLIEAETLIDKIVQKNFNLWDWENKNFDRIIHQKIADQLDIGQVLSSRKAAAAYEAWDWRERQAKFINSDLQDYDFFDVNWWLPLWDRDYVNFWETVPLEYRYNKQLSEEYVRKQYTNVADIDWCAAGKTQARRGDPFERLNNLTTFYTSELFNRVSNSRLRSFLLPFYIALKRRRISRNDHPLGFYGCMTEHQFNELSTGRENIHSYRALEAVDRISFDPPEMNNAPKNGQVTLPV